MMDWFLAFAGMVVLDIVFAFYTLKVAQRAEIQASLFATAILGLNGLVTVLYVEDNKLIVPAMVGAFVGTWIAIKIDKRFKK